MSLGRSEEEGKWVCRIKMEEMMGEMKTIKQKIICMCVVNMITKLDKK